MAEPQNKSILAQSEENRPAYSLLRLLCFALFPVWQMGILSPNGKTVWQYGGTGLYLHSKIDTAMMIAGYVIGILIIILLPGIIVRMERALCVCALASAALLNLILIISPGSGALITALLILHILSGQLMMGFEYYIIIHLFSKKTAVVYLTLVYAFVFVMIGVLQNEIIAIPQLISRLALFVFPALQLFFYFALPAKTNFRIAKKRDESVRSKRLFAGMYGIVYLSAITFLFGHSQAERVANGVSVFYFSGAAAGVIVYLIWKWRGISPLRMITFLFAAGALGFIAAVLSAYAPILAYAACVLCGVSGIMGALYLLLGLTLANQYPSRLIVPIIILLTFAGTLTSMLLLTVFWYNHPLLYAVQLAIAVSAIVLFLVMEPYLLFAAVTRPATKDEEAAALPAEKPVTAPGIATWRENLQANTFEALADYEIDVAGCIMHMMTNEEIAKELHYSIDTIKTYRKRLYSKLQIHKRSELFAAATRKLDREEGGDAHG
ncbi:MAG: helix-turn-helix transcriptional regulator [Oscillospiraceae bacterium]|jgi:DNA-binding CsgD family transcriptional regulator|nr:helix-turn-helix transcriptional regulator [Oscillospiraceae bacterium]